jgi:hypothetical protein
MKAYGSGYIDPHFLNLGTSWRWKVSFKPRPLSPEERAAGTHWIGVWVDPGAGIDEGEKRKFVTLKGLELRPLGRPAGSQSLYRPQYPCPIKYNGFVLNISRFLCKPPYCVNYISDNSYTYPLCYILQNSFWCPSRREKTWSRNQVIQRYSLTTWKCQ